MAEEAKGYYFSQFCGLTRWLFSVCPGLCADWACCGCWLGLSLQVGLMGLQRSVWLDFVRVRARLRDLLSPRLSNLDSVSHFIPFC